MIPVFFGDLGRGTPHALPVMAHGRGEVRRTREAPRFTTEGMDLMRSKIVAFVTTCLLGVGLSAAMPPGADGDPPPESKEEKGDRGSGGDLRKTYDLLRRLKADGRGTGRPEQRLKDWTDRATSLYRDALKASERGEARQARAFGSAAHDLARAAGHVRNASSSGIDDLPPPPAEGGHAAEAERTLRDLRHAHDRLVDLPEWDGGEAGFYLDAAKDLYNAARRDLIGGRLDRSGELARAAEALTHVPEHLARAVREKPEPPKARRNRPEPKPERGRPEPKKKRDLPEPGGAIPPPID